MKHLPRDRALFDIAAQVHAAYEQFAFAYLCLEEKAKLTIGIPVVDDLNDRSHVRTNVVEHHESGFRHEVPPLPVAMELGGELLQRRMFRIAKNAQRMRRLLPRPLCIPEDRGKPGRDIAVDAVQGRHEQHFLTILQSADSALIDAIRYKRLPRRLSVKTCRINPNVPIVHKRCSLNRNR